MDTQPLEDFSSQGSTRNDIWSDNEVGYETDLTNLIDIANSAWLFVDDDHLPEYYLQLTEDFNKTEDIKEDYSFGITRLLDWIKEQWFL